MCNKFWSSRDQHGSCSVLPFSFIVGQGDAHGRLPGEMNIAHKDPFDRLLIAQAQSEGMVVMSNEALFDGFAINRH